jgi:hypothetical protein
MKDSPMSAWRPKQLAILGQDYGFGACGRNGLPWPRGRIGAFVLFSGLEKIEIEGKVIHEGFAMTAHPKQFSDYPSRFPDAWASYRGQILEACFRDFETERYSRGRGPIYMTLYGCGERYSRGRGPIYGRGAIAFHCPKDGGYKAYLTDHDKASAAQERRVVEKTAVYLKIRPSCGLACPERVCNCNVCSAKPFWLPGENVVLETGGYEARQTAVQRSKPAWPDINHKRIQTKVEVEEDTELADLTAKFEHASLIMVQQRAGTFPWRMKKEETQVSTKEELIAEMYKRQVDGRVAGKAPEHMIDTQPATKLTKAAKKAKDAKTKETEVAKAKKVEDDAKAKELREATKVVAKAKKAEDDAKAKELREATKVVAKAKKAEDDAKAKELREATKVEAKQAKAAKAAVAKQAKELREATKVAAKELREATKATKKGAKAKKEAKKEAKVSNAHWRQGFLEFKASKDRDMRREEFQRSKLNPLLMRHPKEVVVCGGKEKMMYPALEPRGSLRYLCKLFDVPLSCQGKKNKEYLIDALIHAGAYVSEYAARNMPKGGYATPRADDSARIRSAYVDSLKKEKKDACIGENVHVPTGFSTSYALRKCCEKHPGGPAFDQLVCGDGLGVSVTLSTIADSVAVEVSRFIGTYTPIGTEDNEHGAGACYVRVHGLGRNQHEAYVFYDTCTESWFLSRQAFDTTQPAAIAVMCGAGSRWAHLPLPRRQKWAQFTSNTAETIAVEGVELRFDAWDGDDDYSDVAFSSAHRTVSKETADTANVGSGQPTTKVATNLAKLERELSNELVSDQTQYHAEDPGVSAAADARMQKQVEWPGKETAAQLYSSRGWAPPGCQVELEDV